MSVIVGVLGEYVLPRSEAKREYVYNVLIKDEQPEDKMLKSRIHFQGKDGYFFYFGFFDGYKNTLRVVDIIKFDDTTGTISERISASSAEWKQNRWFLHDCEIRKFKNHNPVEWKYYSSIMLPVMDVKPEDFIRITKRTVAMNFFELRDYIERLKKTGDDFSKELVDLHVKIAYPMTNLIVIFFFIPIATSNIRSKGRGWIFMLGLVVCFMYLTIMRISQSLGYNQILPPVIAAWAPNVLFTIIGYFFLRKAEI
jgi:lipopolysaccharide export system permease protein